jgi:hypothetical protein
MRCTWRVAPALALLATVALAAQEWQPPRTPDGQPDIQGFWDTDQYARDIETELRNPLAVRIQRQAIHATLDGGVHVQADARRRQGVRTDGTGVCRGRACAPGFSRKRSSSAFESARAEVRSSWQ